MADAKPSDALIAAAIEAVAETETPPSRRSVVRRVVREGGYRLHDAHEAVLDYCLRHDVTLFTPKMTPLRMILGCASVLLVPTLFLCVIFSIISSPYQPAVPPAMAAIGKPLVKYGKYGWTALLTLLLLRSLRGNGWRQALFDLRQVRPLLLLQNFGVALVTIGCALLLVHFCPFLDLSWLYLLPGNHHQATNINIWPATIKYFGLLFLVLLSLNLPALARAEEVKYRQGTRDWRDGLGRSLRFGLAHCWAGIPLYAALALTVGGLWFTRQYFRGGVERSTRHHVAYNLVIVSMFFVVLLTRLT